MKKLLMMSLAFFAMGTLASCKGRDAGPAPVADISSQVAAAICKRAIECTPNIPLKKEDCASQTVASLTALINEKKIQFTRAELTGCLKMIAEGTCEEVMNPQGPPKGCEKLQ